MVNFLDYLSKRAVSVPPLPQREIQNAPQSSNPHAVTIMQPPQGAQPVQVATVPDTSIVERIDPILTTIEQVTGLTRREIFLQVLKSGVRGGGVSGLLEGLLGQKPAPEAKFIRYVKTAVIWGLVALLGGGLVIITLIGYAHLMTKMIGG